MNRLFSILAVFFASGVVWADPQSYPFKLAMQTVDGRHVVMAKNEGPAPILAKVQLKALENAVIDPSSHIALVVPPHESVLVATLRQTEKGGRNRVATSFKFSIGDPDARHDPETLYLLPFREGQSIKIGQMVGGRITTHTGTESKYAIDFSVPEGTPILAARSGQVVDVDRDFTRGGNDPALKANHVLLLHDDGTLGLYSHFAAKQIVVSNGERVEAGALLGFSGNTGFSAGPHLHFAVLINTRTPDGSAKYLSIPFEFAGDNADGRASFTQGQRLVTHHPVR